MSAKTPKEVERLVNAELDKWRIQFEGLLEGLRASVLPGTVRKQEGWWYVPVGTNREPSRRFAYYDVLSNVEDKLKKRGLNVLIVPSGTQVAKSSR